jgi:hypothetical protein
MHLAQPRLWFALCFITIGTVHAGAAGSNVPWSKLLPTARKAADVSAIDFNPLATNAAPSDIKKPDELAGVQTTIQHYLVGRKIQGVAWNTDPALRRALYGDQIIGTGEIVEMDKSDAGAAGVIKSGAIITVKEINPDRLVFSVDLKTELFAVDVPVQLRPTALDHTGKAFKKPGLGVAGIGSAMGGLSYQP